MGLIDETAQTFEEFQTNLRSDPMPVTKEEVRAALETVRAVGDAIRELGEVPSGHLYAQLSSVMSLDEYNTLIDCLKRADVVRESNHLLQWVEPS